MDYLAQGIDIDGVDISPEMISLCKLNAEKKGLKPNLYVQSITELNLPRKYKTVLVPSSSLQLLLEPGQPLQAMKLFHDHLEAGGVFATPFMTLWKEGDPLEGEFVREATRPEDGATVRRTSWWRFNPETTIEDTRDTYGHSLEPEGQPLSYHWRQTAGPFVPLTAPRSPRRVVRPPAPGMYEFQLTVKDEFNTSPPDSVKFYLGQCLPVANAGPTRYAAQTAITLDGSGSFAPNSSAPLQYAWRVVSGPPLTLAPTNVVNPVVGGFTQTTISREAVFELVVSSGELTSVPSTVKMVIVPAWGEVTITNVNPPFNPNRPTIFGFGGGDCSRGHLLKYPANWYGVFPSFAEVLTSKDLNGRMDGFLASDEDFQFVKELHRCHRIIQGKLDVGVNYRGILGSSIVPQFPSTQFPIFGLNRSNRRNRPKWLTNPCVSPIQNTGGEAESEWGQSLRRSVFRRGHCE